MTLRLTYHTSTIQKALGLFLILLGWVIAGYAQDTGMPDSLRTRQEARPQSQRPQQDGQQQEGQIDFQATDSLIFTFKKDRIATLYGSAKVDHQAGELSSGKISLNLDKTLVSAATQSPEDTLSQPVLVRENDRIRSENIEFNYQTEKGRFEVARVKVQQGNLIGTKVKNTSRNTVFLEDAIYSTCELDHPHYFIKADRMKVVDREKVFFTKARLYILDIPYPLVFPFGYLPGKFDQKQSGLLQPTYAYQNQERRGIGIQNLGWFQYFNDYIVGEASVDIFTSGTFFLNGRTSYSNRGKYSGSVNIGYSQERGLEKTDPNFSVNTQRRINISHNQDFSPYANISANIDLRTADYFRRNSFDIDERAEVSTGSSISYRYRHPENIYNFSISARQNQNFNTNVTRLSGPSASFSLKQLSPFQSDRSAPGNSTWYENISLRYQNSFESDYNFTPINRDSAQINWFEALIDPAKYRQATGNNDHYQFGFRQQSGISFGRLIPSQYINMSASGNYNEYWYPTSIRKSFNPDSNEVEVQRVRGFTTARDFSTGLSLSTTVYGLINKGIGNIQGFRHTLRPSLSFSYSPDFSSDFWGYYREVRVDTASNRTQTYSIFEDEVFRGPSRGEQRALGLNISNVFEAKQVKRDSTGEKNEKTLRLIDQLNLSTSYNFAADSLRLSDLNTSFSSSIIKGINIRANARFNFYKRDTLGRRVDQFLFESTGKPAELTSFSVSTSYSINTRGGRSQANQNPYFPAQYDPFNQSIFNEMDPGFNSTPVQRPNSPFSISFNFRYSWRLNPTGKNNTSATLNAQNIQFQLTPKWNFSTRIGYDFVKKELTPSQFSLSRDLHCWNLSFTMNPFGDFQYFAFRLSVDSGQIQGIFQKLPILKNLERSSSPSGRRPRF